MVSIFSSTFYRALFQIDKKTESLFLSSLSLLRSDFDFHLKMTVFVGFRPEWNAIIMMRLNFISLLLCLSFFIFIDFFTTINLSIQWIYSAHKSMKCNSIDTHYIIFSIFVWHKEGSKKMCICNWKFWREWRDTWWHFNFLHKKNVCNRLLLHEKMNQKEFYA